MFPEFVCPQLNHLPKYQFSSNSFEVTPFSVDIPDGSATGSNSESHLASAPSSRLHFTQRHLAAVS